MSEHVHDFWEEEYPLHCDGCQDSFSALFIIRQQADDIEALKRERTQFILTMQQHQPSGSPPSGTLDLHLRWVLESIERERDAAVAESEANDAG